MCPLVRDFATSILPVTGSMAKTCPDAVDRDGRGTNILATIREWYFSNAECHGIVTK